VELYPQLSTIAPSLFGTYLEYARRFCNAHQGRFGWDVSGASNVAELHVKLQVSDVSLLGRPRPGRFSSSRFLRVGLAFWEPPRRALDTVKGVVQQAGRRSDRSNECPLLCLCSVY